MTQPIERTIDLGGAPAQEPCAQLGQTPGFAALNALEVEVFRAALIARYGAPPAGCRFTPLEHAHDFGSYRTLGLAIDTAAALDEAVVAYRAAVGDGLATWVAAGFAPPVVYDGVVGTAPRTDLAEIVIGALATTRPAWDGSFPLAEFATLHANLAAAFPAEAATFAERVRVLAPAVATTRDPRFTDAAGAPLEGMALSRAVAAAAVAAAAPILEAHGIARIVIAYDGGGDSGQINEVAAEAADGGSVALPAVGCERFATGYDGSVVVDVTSLEAALEEIGTEALAAYHSGWENNDGAFGTVTIDVAARTATLDHNVYFTDSELFTTAL